MAFRSKTNSVAKHLLKEKIVSIYERFFRGEDLYKENPNFWEELFLLKPNISHLRKEIQNLNDEQIIRLKNHFNQFFAQCLKALEHKHHIRIFYSLQTLCTLISCIYNKNNNYCNFDPVDVLIGFNEAEECMRQLLHYCNDFLIGNWPCSLKAICLKLLLILVTGSDNIVQNSLIEYLMMYNIFETLIQLLCKETDRLKFGQDAIVLLTLLINYKKNEIANPYVVKLSILDDELSLNGYGLVIAHTLAGFCTQYIVKPGESSSVHWFKSLTHAVENIFVTEEDVIPFTKIKETIGVILAFYEIVHLNRNFVSILVHTRKDVNFGSSLINSNNENHEINDADDAKLALNSIFSKPLNLFIIMLQYCSIAMQNAKYEEGKNMKLCFIILTCITEDQYANSLMHDFHLVFKVQLFKMPRRHHIISQDKSQTLAATLLDLITEFIMSHMMKSLPIQLYYQCIGIIHRLLCYQKKYTVRIEYNWKTLWESLIMLLKFLLISDTYLPKSVDNFSLALQIINIFNIFIMYGDTVLASPRCYDLLYYEIIRLRAVFEDVHSLALKYLSMDCDYKDIVSRIIGSLVNVRSIVNHFTPKIEKWMLENSSTPTENEVLHVLRKNYDSLTLKLLDNLDQYERYSEKPQHISLFSSLVRDIILDTRQRIDYTNFNIHNILQEFSSISSSA